MACARKEVSMLSPVSLDDVCMNPRAPYVPATIALHINRMRFAFRLKGRGSTNRNSILLSWMSSVVEWAICSFTDEIATSRRDHGKPAAVGFDGSNSSCRSF